MAETLAQRYGTKAAKLRLASTPPRTLRPASLTVQYRLYAFSRKDERAKFLRVGPRHPASSMDIHATYGALEESASPPGVYEADSNPTRAVASSTTPGTLHREELSSAPVLELFGPGYNNGIERRALGGPFRLFT